MKVIVDTSVWSLALGRSSSEQQKISVAASKLNILLENGDRILLPGIIIQEILQGIKKQEQFSKVLKALTYFPIIEAKREDHIFAAKLFNLCRSKGIQASSVDFLISALSIQYKCHLLTNDTDFKHIAKHTNLKLL